MFAYEFSENIREQMQTRLIEIGIFKIRGRHLYECSLDEMNNELRLNREVDKAIMTIEKKY